MSSKLLMVEKFWAHCIVLEVHWDIHLFFFFQNTKSFTVGKRFTGRFGVFPPILFIVVSWAELYCGALGFLQFKEFELYWDAVF